MKNLVLTTVVLLLTINLHSNSNIPVVINSLAATDTVVNKKIINNNINTSANRKNLNNKAKNNIKTKHTSHKKKSISKNKRKTNVRFIHKMNVENQANLKLHRRMSADEKSIKKGTVKFGFDENTLTNINAFNEILHIADKLIFDSTLQVSLSGFTDNIGSAAYNDVLSLKRAQMVKDYLVDLGVNEAQIHLSFSGMSAPIADNNTPDGRAENRRVEFVLFAVG